MKKYKYVKTWVGEDGKRKVVRSDDEETMWAKYFEARYGDATGKPSTITVSEWFYKAVDIYKTNLGADTKYNYIKCCEKHILPQIGKMMISNVQASDCQTILNNLKGSSLQLISQVQQILNFIFKTAIYNSLTNNNPAEHLQKPKGKEKEHHRALYPEEREALKELFDGPYQERLRIFEIMYFCGCRPSEVWSMTKANIVQKNHVYLLHVKGTKTAAADRYVPIDEKLVDKIKRQKSNFICTTEQGNPLDKSKYRRIVLRLYRELDIIMGAEVYRNKIIESKLYPDFVPYDIRHDYCSRLKNANVDIRVAQYLMGHSDISVTANIYTHTSDTDIDKIGKEIIEGIAEIPNPWASLQRITL